MNYWANLSTDTNVDYRKLRNLLLSKQYNEADEETRQLFLEIAGCKNKGYLDANDFKNIPCIDVRIIDQLWMDNSSSKYGFSAQKNVFEKKSYNCEKIFNWYGSKTYTIEESHSYYREKRQKKRGFADIFLNGYPNINNLEGEDNCIRGQKIIASHQVSHDTWFDEDFDYFSPHSKPKGYYPYKYLIYLEEKKSKVKIKKPINSWSDVGNAVLDVIINEKKFSVNTFEITVLEPKKYLAYSTIESICECLNRCGIHGV